MTISDGERFKRMIERNIDEFNQEPRDPPKNREEFLFGSLKNLADQVIAYFSSIGQRAPQEIVDTLKHSLVLRAASVHSALDSLDKIFPPEEKTE